VFVGRAAEVGQAVSGGSEGHVGGTRGSPFRHQVEAGMPPL